MHPETVTAMHARKNLGDLLDKIRLLGSRFIITRRNTPIAILHPYEPAAAAVAATKTVIRKHAKKTRPERPRSRGASRDVRVQPPQAG